MSLSLDSEVAVEDRRNALRQSTRPKAIMMIDDENAEHAGVLVDVSRTGLRIRTRACLPCGSDVIVMPPSHYALQPVRARIMRQAVRDGDEGELFELGMLFGKDSGSNRHAWFLELRNCE